MGTIALATVHGGIGTTGITTISSISVDQFGRVYSLSAARPLNNLTYSAIAVLSALSTDNLGRVIAAEQADTVNALDTSTQFAVVTSIKSDALGRLTKVGYNSTLGYLLLALTAVQLPINLNTSGSILTSIKTDFLGRVLSAGASNAKATAFDTTTIANVSGLTVDEIGRVISLKQSNTVNALSVGTLGYSISSLNTDALGRVTSANLKAPVNITVGNGLSIVNGNGIAGDPLITPVAQFQTVSLGLTIHSSNYTTYFNKTILASNTITLSFDQSIPAGFQCSVVNVNTGVISLSASPTLNAAGSQTLASQYDACTVFKDSVNIYAIGNIT
jgi:hypothetical protein